MYSFDDISESMAKTHRMLLDNLAEKDDVKGGGIDPEKDESSWDILYGFETREALKKVMEAQHWIDAARVSVG